MRVELGDPCPLPEDPTLAAASVALEQGGHWGWVFDSEWSVVYMTEAIRTTMAGSEPMVPLIIGENLFSSSSIDLSRTYSFPPLLHENFPALGPLMLADFDGDSARLRAVIDESFGALVDLLEPDDAAVRTYTSEALSVGTRTSVVNTATRLRDGAGRLRGATIVAEPMGCEVLCARWLNSAVGDELVEPGWRRWCHEVARWRSSSTTGDPAMSVSVSGSYPLGR